MRLTLYHEQANFIQAALRKLQQISHDLGIEQSARQAGEIARQISDDRFRLVIVGEFSRGKSTFVNALLGRKILPASKNPTTAIISKIVYGEKPSYTVFYKGKQLPQALSEEKFIKLTAPKEPNESDEASVAEYVKAQEALAQIDYAEISYPLPFCKENVEIVDTPGTNDLNIGRMEITYGYLNQADAVVLLLSATQPLSASEAQFLRERILANQIQDIFFVISRKDELDNEKQEQSVIQFVSKHLKTILPQSFCLKNRIFLVASRGALFYQMQQHGEKISVKQELEIPEVFEDTGLPDFSSALGDFLMNEKGKVKLRKYRRRVQAVLQTVQHDITVNLDVLSHSTDEIRQKIAEMEPKFQKAKYDAEREIQALRRTLSRLSLDIETECIIAKRSIHDMVNQTVDNLSEGMDKTDIQREVERAMTMEKRCLIEKILHMEEDKLHTETEKARTALQRIWADIDVASAFRPNLPAVSQNISAFPTLEIDLKIAKISEGEAFWGTLSLGAGIGGIIGGAAFLPIVGALAIGGWLLGLFEESTEKKKAKLKQELCKHYDKDYEKMIAAVVNHYKMHVDDFCKHMETMVQGRITDMEQQLQSVLNTKRLQEQDAEMKRNYLLQQQEVMRKIDRDMMGIGI